MIFRTSFFWKLEKRYFLKSPVPLVKFFTNPLAALFGRLIYKSASSTRLY